MWYHKIPGEEREGEGRLIECGIPKGEYVQQLSGMTRLIGCDHSMYTPSSMSRLIGCDHSMHMLRLNRHNHPKTYQLDQAYGI